MPEPDPNDPVRVKDNDTGHEFTTRRSAAAHGNYELLDAETVDPVTGDFLPPKFATQAPQENGSGGYVDSTKDELQAEIARRNAGRGEESVIEVAAPGNKPDLIAALEADDNNEEI